MNPSIQYWLAAICLPSITPLKFLRGLESFSDIEKLFHASTDELLLAGFSLKEVNNIKNPNWHQVEKEINWARSTPDQWIITYNDLEYPNLLKEISDPPLVLYGRGNRVLLNQPQIAMVGSRHPSSYGIKNAEFFSKGLASSNLVVTSGLALGVDGACHQGALEVNGATIGICGTGLNYVYPTSHKRLVEKILAQNGVLISEFSTDTRPFAANFPRRNRIIAGLSVGVVVIEAALKSGSLITARHAMEHGREVFAIPGNIHHPLSQGGHYLLRQGAKLVEKVQDVLDELAHLNLTVSTFARAKSQNSLAPISAECEQLLIFIEYETTPMDVIVLRSGFTASQVSSMLLMLEINGYIESVTGGYVKILNPMTKGAPHV